MSFLFILVGEEITAIRPHSLEWQSCMTLLLLFSASLIKVLLFRSQLMLWEIFISLQCTARTGNANMEITTCCSDGLLRAVQGLLNVQNQKGARMFVFNSARKGWAGGVLDQEVLCSWGAASPASMMQPCKLLRAFLRAMGQGFKACRQTDTTRQCKVNTWLLLSTVLMWIPKYMKAEF